MDKWYHDSRSIAELFSKYEKEESVSVMKPKEQDDYVPETKEDRMFESFAKEAMRELVTAGLADFVLLRNDKLRKWWQEVVKKEMAEQAKREAIEHKKKLKEQALAKLSDEEKEALGLTRKKK